MVFSRFTQLILFVLLAGCGMTCGQEIEFNRDVRPILSNHCFACHGPDSATREGGFRLDLRDSALGQADSGKTPLVPGNAVQSEVMRRIASVDPDERMPPAGKGKPLDKAQLKIISSWIEQGAAYQEHWAFLTPQSPRPPDNNGSPWPRNPIDQFVLKRLSQQGLKPARTATRETLIRRVAFDLTGLPPEISQINTFLSDRSPEAYLNMVDRYLQSSAYGEHMARHWLDLARYADSNGYQYDTERQQWVWRDWVIDAYNRNLPFNEFTREQLAGDLIPGATPQQRLATGFNRNHGITIEGGIIDEEYRTEYVMDRLVTTGAVWMGLTIGCARCHEHKFDPISQKEFYQMFAFFNQVPEKGMRGFSPQQTIASPLANQARLKLDSELAVLEQELKRPFDIEQAVGSWLKQLANQKGGWYVLDPIAAKLASSGGSKLTRLEDLSVLAGGANPSKDIYTIVAGTSLKNITAVRLEALMDPTLPGGGPGRHSNSNFVLSEFELDIASGKPPGKWKSVRFDRSLAEYSQRDYGIEKTIDGTVAGNNGWAVDGPTRKKPVTAIFVARKPFGEAAPTELRFRLRHEATFATHGIGRTRLSVTTDPVNTLSFQGVPGRIRELSGLAWEKLSTVDQQVIRQYFLKHHDPRNRVKQRIAEIKRQKLASFPPTMVMQELPNARKTFVLNRGQYNDRAEQVNAGVPGIFPPLPQNAPLNRLGFARWLTDPSHPLTARVAVNRYWQRLFGLGLVKTSEDFGVQGEMPSHPGLLDWLACEFVRKGWDVKEMQRLILNSATYRQSSKTGALSYQRDPENRLLSRGPRMRMDAEEIRDGALLMSGLLVNQVGGKSVYPYQPSGLWLELNNRPGLSKAYPVGQGNDLYRRSVYTFWKRTVPSPMLKTFDAPEREFCTIRRSRTNTPLQALLLMNGPQFVEAARGLGARMIREGGQSVDSRLQYGFRLATGRKPKEIEMVVLREALKREHAYYKGHAETVANLLAVGTSWEVADLDEVELAAYTSVARLILNLTETITKG